MKVKYNGPNPLAYHSAPSAFEYLFDPGVPQVVKKEDEQFFKSISTPVNSSWEVVGLKSKVVNSVDDIVTSGKDNYAKNKTKIKGGNR